MEKNGVQVRKGAWTKEEDTLLKNCIEKYGEGKWHKVPPRAGLNRCRKSCRLRWLNYLRPDIKRGYFTTDEVDLVIRLHKLLGNRWSLIAGRIPGRTANDVKNFWNTHIFKKSLAGKNEKNVETKTFTQNKILFKPRPRILSKSHVLVRSSEEENKTNETKDDKYNKPSASLSQEDGRNNIEFPIINNVPFSLSEEEVDECIRCWLEAADEPTPALFSDEDGAIMQPLFSPTQINQKIAEFSSLAIDDHLWDFTNFD